MKKIVFVALITLGISVSASAQDQRGGGRGRFGGDPTKMKAQLSQTYQDSLGFSKEKADTAAGVEVASMQKMMSLFQPGGDRESMRSAMQTANQDKEAQLKTLLTADEFTKLDAYNKSHKRGMGGGPRGGGMRRNNSSED